MSAPLRIGTRSSPLALAQSAWVADLLGARTGHPAVLVPVETTGDRWQRAAGDPTEVQGIFTRELEEALRSGAVDVCVHSAKDVPPLLPDGLGVVAFPPRADARDALVVGAAVSPERLSAGARVGTGSLRRATQLRRLWPGVEVVPLRGNVDTRLGRVQAGDLDAVVLAACGLERLGRAWEISRVLAPAEMVPAAGQGALALESALDSPVRPMLAALDHPATRLAVTAERAVLAALGAGCSAPVGVFAAGGETGRLSLTAVVLGARSGEEVRAALDRPLPPEVLGDPAALAEAARAIADGAVAELLARGAARLLAEAEGDAG